MKMYTIVIAASCLAVAACNQQSSLPAATTSASDATPTTDAPDAPTVPAWTGNADGLQELEFCQLDLVNGVQPKEGRFEAVAAAPIALEGWLTNGAGSAPPAFRLVFDGEQDADFEAATGVAREDLAKAMGVGAANGGYRFETASLGLPAGDYTMRLVFVDATGNTAFCNIDQPLSLTSGVDP